ncbi:glycosyltransferase [Aminivibrio sp.]|uniref:glycosyltransferase n=1 Tax=Aminivibrio sp. TaxID=1872489 RepID=UPI001A4C19BA|nr:glycosyltransferase [Aminivibrio sp.]MBL3538301.1 glycosyltransferase [Aminivibrio sp.]
MNLLFFAMDENSPSSGLSKKIKSQAEALGVESSSLWLIMASRKEGVFLYRFERISNQLVLEEHTPGEKKRSLWRRYEYYAKIVSAVFDRVCMEKSIEAVYCRRISMIPCLIQMFKKAKKRYGFFLGYEIPTYPFLMEHIIARQWRNLASELIFSKALYVLVDHFFLITDTASESKIPFKNWTRISNGINVDRIPLRSAVRPIRDGLHLLGLANVAFWHGYDRVIKGLSDYYGDANNKFPIFFHIAGEGPVLSSLKKMALDFDVEKHVIFHGPVYGEELEELFTRCHIGVASLGGHRKKINETSELKAREYCARGMPFFMSMKDPDFDVNLDFIHYVPEDDSAINMNDIVHFSRSMIKNSDAVIKEMRVYAELHLDWKKTMKKVYSVFTNLEETKEDVACR